MSIVKYVIFEIGDEKHGLYMPVLFPEHITHKQVQLEGCRLVSAGFYNVDKQYAFGESESLKLMSNPKRDSTILRRALDGSGTWLFQKDHYE